MEIAADEIRRSHAIIALELDAQARALSAAARQMVKAGRG